MAGAPDRGVGSPEREALLRALRDGGVRFVLIGGAALESHGIDYTTKDIDVTPEREHENLERLASVLNGLSCQLELDPDTAIDLPGDYFTAATLGRATVWNLRTVHGKIDLTVEPSAFAGAFRGAGSRCRRSWLRRAIQTTTKKTKTARHCRGRGVGIVGFGEFRLPDNLGVDPDDDRRL